MNLIVVMGERWEIGKDGDLPTHLLRDMKYFRGATSGRAVVMGRRTLKNFPGEKPLKNRVNMVLSRSESYSPEGVQVYHRAEDVLEALENYNEGDVFIIGGGMTYREFLPHYDKVYVTYVHRIFEVDTDFESLDQGKNWKLESVGDSREHEGTSSEFRIYRRVE